MRLPRQVWQRIGVVGRTLTIFTAVLLFIGAPFLILLSLTGNRTDYLTGKTVLGGLAAAIAVSLWDELLIFDRTFWHGRISGAVASMTGVYLVLGAVNLLHRFVTGHLLLTDLSLAADAVLQFGAFILGWTLGPYHPVLQQVDDQIYTYVDAIRAQDTNKDGPDVFDELDHET